MNNRTARNRMTFRAYQRRMAFSAPDAVERMYPETGMRWSPFWWKRTLENATR